MRLIGIFMLLVIQVSAFVPSPPSSTKQQPFISTQIHVFKKKSAVDNSTKNCNQYTRRTAEKNRPPGVGGLGIGGIGGVKKSGVANKSSTVQKKVVTNNKKKSPTVTGNNAQTDIDWPTVIIAFLTPWRNPNSIFLYMLLILNILGTINEAKN